MAKQRVVDKWKTKTWYTIIAPEIFEMKEIGVVPADDDAKLFNRIIRLSLAEITGEMAHTYSMLAFRVHEVKGKSAFTKLIGHELSASYLRSLVRRKRDIINEVVDVVTKDGAKVRVKLSIYTARKATAPAKTLVRKAARAEVEARAKEMDFPTFIQEIIYGKFSSRVYKACKRFLPIKRVEIRKTEVAEVFANK